MIEAPGWKKNRKFAGEKAYSRQGISDIGWGRVKMPCGLPLLLFGLRQEGSIIME